MRALLPCVALISLWAQCTFGFAFSAGSYREARQNYYEILTNCEKEGGECLEVDFGTTDPPSPPETTTPAPTPAPRPTTPAPLPPIPVTQPFFWQFWPFVPVPVVPAPTVPAPRPTTHTPLPVKAVPLKVVPVKAAPVKVKAVKAKAPKRARKIKGAKGKRQRKNRGEQEREVRKRRQAFAPDPWDYLYNECTGGWEFDLGCGARGGNVCCYSSNNNNY